MKHRVSIGIEKLHYVLPNTKRSIDSLSQVKKITSEPALLKKFGFQSAYLYEENRNTAFTADLIKAAQSVMPPQKEKLEMAFLYRGIPAEQSYTPKRPTTLFRYAASQIHEALELPNDISINTLSEQGCSGFLAMLSLANQILQASEKDAILCITGDFLPADCNREILYNLMSDATSAVLLQKNSTANKIIAFHLENQSNYWDTPEHEEELMAGYFPMAALVIEKCLAKADMSLQDIRMVIPHNVSLRSWEILVSLLGIPIRKVWTDNISAIGHTVSCDHIINLHDAADRGDISKGDKLLLFTFGFGASWSAMIIEH